MWLRRLSLAIVALILLPIGLVAVSPQEWQAATLWRDYPPRHAPMAMTADVTLKATPSWATFYVTYINSNQIDVTYIAPMGTTNVTIRAKVGSYPTSITDGYLVYSGAVTTATISDSALNFDDVDEVYYVGFSDDGTAVWVKFGQDKDGGLMIFFAALALIAITLTLAMFISKQAMLGFPSAIFWFVFGGYCYTQSTIPWGDIWYFLFFSAMGMGIFSMLAAWGLRTKKEEMVEGDEYFDEGTDDIKFIDEKGTESRMVQGVRGRAERRRELGIKRKSKWGI